MSQFDPGMSPTPRLHESQSSRLSGVPSDFQADSRPRAPAPARGPTGNPRIRKLSVAIPAMALTAAALAMFGAALPLFQLSGTPAVFQFYFWQDCRGSSGHEACAGWTAYENLLETYNSTIATSVKTLAGFMFVAGASSIAGATLLFLGGILCLLKPRVASRDAFPTRLPVVLLLGGGLLVSLAVIIIPVGVENFFAQEGGQSPCQAHFVASCGSEQWGPGLGWVLLVTSVLLLAVTSLLVRRVQQKSRPPG